jgi:putative tryptophan/tyrosine transport system substrate-binding protein
MSATRSGSASSPVSPGRAATSPASATSWSLTPKRLELLSELVPRAAVIALLVSPGNSIVEGLIRSTQEAAGLKGVQLRVLKATTEAEIDAAFAAIEQLQAGGLLVANDAFFFSRRAQLVALAARYAVPAIYFNAGFITAGGLISYGPDVLALYREAGIYAGRILQGAKAADLPVQLPTTFKLVINLQTAKALGLTIPPSILARADEVIE